MNFKFTPWLRKSRQADETTFTIKRLWQSQPDHKGNPDRQGNPDHQGDETEISHLIDRSYRYRSARELRWHIAERFGLPVEGVELSRI